MSDDSNFVGDVITGFTAEDGGAARRGQRGGTAGEAQVHLYAGGAATAGMSELIINGSPFFFPPPPPPGRPLLFTPHPSVSERARGGK